jgi:murein DD-endopeptidase MepM/ murein hydrolase activator NlpD
LPHQTFGLSTSAMAEERRGADKFQHPLWREELSKSRAGSDGWYISRAFGAPFGQYCEELRTPVCYNLGEDWKHEVGGLGRPVYAVANGEILDFGYSAGPKGKLPKSLGNYILIKHSLPEPGRHVAGLGFVTTVVSLYAHLLDLKGICGKDSQSCAVGQAVKIGALIGHVGATGASHGPSLHFEIRLMEDKCLDRGSQDTASASCFKYSRARYPVRYAKGQGWVDPSCFIENAEAPRNDSVSRAIQMNIGDTKVGSNVCATKEDDEPNHAGRPIDRFGRNADGKSVWWRFTAPENADYTVSTGGSEFDTIVAVYVRSGESFAAIARSVRESSSLCGSASYCSSKTTISAKAGDTYYIAVDGMDAKGRAAASGVIRLTVANADARLFVTPGATAFQPGLEGGPFAPASVAFQVSASEPIAYSISNVPAWLTPSMNLGTARRIPTSISVSINGAANSLGPGIHEASIVFASSSKQPPTTRTISLRVMPNLALEATLERSTAAFEASADPLPKLVVRPDTNLVAVGPTGGPFRPRRFTYYLRSRNGVVKYRVTGLPKWLTVSDEAGVVRRRGRTELTFRINRRADNMRAGIHAETVVIRNVTNGKGTARLRVKLRIEKSYLVGRDGRHLVTSNGGRLIDR